MTDEVPINDEWFGPPEVNPLTSHEPFTGVSATVMDFWRFAMSDLRMNNSRGYLAAFLVARAVGADGTRVEWDTYDVLAPDGTRIEVKTGVYLQAGEQRGPSRITFGGLRGRAWTPRTGYGEKPTYNADVYVFCVHTATTHAQYDPLDVSQWEFCVVARRRIEDLGFKSVGLGAVARISEGPTSHSKLASAVASAVV